jgi:hypothetical protein
MSIFSFLGTSKTHYSNASDYFSKATESAGNIVNSLWSSVSNVELLYARYFRPLNKELRQAY